MRMWMVDPRVMCRQHLLSEHKEIHMLVGCIIKCKSIKGFLEKRLVEPTAIYRRHDKLVREMIFRGYSHKSPLPPVGPTLPSFITLNIKVPRRESFRELMERCDKCYERFQNLGIISKTVCRNAL